MFDMILTVVLLIISVVLSITLDLNNAALESLVEIVPLTIVTFRLWYNRPRNYIKIMGCFNRNVKYHMTIKMEECDIDLEFYNKMTTKLKDLCGKNNGKFVRNDIGDYLWNSYIEVDANLLEITYSMESNCMYFEMKSKTKFRSFINDTRKMLSAISNLFSNSKCKHKSELINIEIGFINKTQQDIINPLVSKYFEKFKNISFNMRYEGENGSKIEVSNRGIIIKGNNIDEMEKDLKKEMLLF